MSRKSVLSLSKRGLALKVLSKFLYAIADNSPASEELKNLHREVLEESLTQTRAGSDPTGDTFDIEKIPWERLLDITADHNPSLKRIIHSYRFSTQETRYICAMACGLSGKEYGLISGFKSQYNLSWSIRQKIGMQPRTTNLRNFLQKLSDTGLYESLKDNVRK